MEILRRLLPPERLIGLVPVILLGCFSIIALAPSSETVYLADETLSLPTNGDTIQTSAPLKKACRYEIVVSSSRPTYPPPLAEPDRGYLYRSYSEDPDMRTAVYKYSGRGEPLILKLIGDYSSKIESAQARVKAESLFDQWSREGTPGWVVAFVIVTVLFAIGTMAHALYPYWDRWQTRVEKERHNREHKAKVSKLKQQAERLRIKAQRESNFLDPDFQDNYARQKQREILVSGPQDLSGLKYWLDSVFEEYKKVSGRDSSYNEDFKYYDLFRLIKRIREFKHIGLNSLRDQWWTEHEAIISDPNLFPLLQKEYPEVVKWLEARRKIVQLAERYEIEVPKKKRMTEEDVRKMEIRKEDRRFKDEKAKLDYAWQKMNELLNDEKEKEQEIEANEFLTPEEKEEQKRALRAATKQLIKTLGWYDENEQQTIL